MPFKGMDRFHNLVHWNFTSLRKLQIGQTVAEICRAHAEFLQGFAFAIFNAQ